MEIRSTKTNVSEFSDVVQAMLRDSAKRWLATADRALLENAIIICRQPPYAFILSNGRLDGTDGWVCDEAILDSVELSDFFATFGSSSSLWLESKLGGKFPVRAFIKDGQRPWTFSVDIHNG